MTLNAAHKGNLDYLRTFMASDEVRKAMVEKVLLVKQNLKNINKEYLIK